MRVFVTVVFIIAGGLIAAGSIWFALSDIADRPIDEETREALKEAKASEIDDLTRQITDQVQMETSELTPEQTQEVGEAAVSELVVEVAEEAVAEVFRKDVSLDNESAVAAVVQDVAAEELMTELPGVEAPAVVEEIADKVGSSVSDQIDLVADETQRQVAEEVAVSEEFQDELADLVSSVIKESIDDAAESGVDLDKPEDVQPVVEGVVAEKVAAAADKLPESIDVERLETVLTAESTIGITQLEARVRDEALKDVDFGQLEQSASSEISEIASREVEALVEDTAGQVVTELVEGKAAPDESVQVADLVEDIVEQEVQETLGGANVQNIVNEVKIEITTAATARTEQLLNTQGLHEAETASGTPWWKPLLLFIGGIFSTVAASRPFREVSGRLLPLGVSVGDNPYRVDPPPKVVDGDIEAEASFKLAYIDREKTILEEIKLECEGGEYHSEASIGRGAAVEVTKPAQPRASTTESLPLLIRPGEQVFITAKCTGPAHKRIIQTIIRRITRKEPHGLTLKAIHLKLGNRSKAFRL